ncbi:MAG: transporter ATP-binding protein, partial [Thermoleophilia bacterium]|nr:transporter ATP-binding protein [Thermoleophilia bacterium]
MLRLDGIEAWYGSIQALKGISLEVYEGEIVSLIGSNGAGKTTTMKTIHGLMKPKAGSMEFLGRDATKLRTEELVKLGMAQSPEGRRVFPRMTVLENLLVAMHKPLMKASGFSVLGILGFPSYARAERAGIDKARAWLERIDLIARADDEAG